MKTTNLCFVLWLSLLGASACTPASTETKADKEPPQVIAEPVKPAQLIEQIKADVAKIDQGIGSYSKRIMDFEIDGREGHLLGWTQEEKVVKIEEELLDDHGPMVTTYYFENEQCIYVLDRSELFEPGKLHVTEDRYFLDGNKLLAHWNKRKSGPDNEGIDLSEVPNETVDPDPFDGEYQAKQAADALKRFKQVAN